MKKIKKTKSTDNLIDGLPNIDVPMPEVRPSKPTPKNYFKGKFSKINLVEPTLRWAERNGYFLFDGIKDVGFTESNIAIIDKGDIAYRILDTADSKRFMSEFEMWLEFVNMPQPHIPVVVEKK